jgi:hypothetical protein
MIYMLRRMVPLAVAAAMFAASDATGHNRRAYYAAWAQLAAVVLIVPLTVGAAL